MKYICSSECGSSGSSIIKVDFQSIIGIHNGGDYYLNTFYCRINYANFIIDVLNDKERINLQDLYHEEENYNILSNKSKTLIGKKYNRRDYKYENLRLTLLYEDNKSSIKFSIENINNIKEKYYYNEKVDENKILELFGKFDDIIDSITIIENDKEYIKKDNQKLLKIEKVKMENTL